MVDMRSMPCRCMKVLMGMEMCSGSHVSANIKRIVKKQNALKRKEAPGSGASFRLISSVCPFLIDYFLEAGMDGLCFSRYEASIQLFFSRSPT